MNTDALRARNARKRAKLRAKKRGEVFTHVFIDVEPVGLSLYKIETKWVGRGHEPAGWTHVEYFMMDGTKCTQVRKETWEIVDFVPLPDGGKFDKWYPPRSTSFVLTSSEKSSESLRGRIHGFISECSNLYSEGLTLRCTVALTSEGQRRVKKWLVTPVEEVETVVADVVAAVSMLGLSQSPATSLS